MRFLRGYEHVAQREHFCDYCFTYIYPGELYRGTVYLTDNGILDIKEHKDPYCPVDPDEEMRKDLERFDELEKIAQRESDFQEAA